MLEQILNFAVGLWPIILAVIIGWTVMSIFMAYRVVVETNKVHIIQQGKTTTSFGTGMAAGNVYYSWPANWPIIGVSRILLPVNNFSLSLHKYKAYDKDRVPFTLDVTAFFRIEDTNRAAARISSFDDLRGQLELIMQGSVRKILASNDIDTIMVERATFGKAFTDEVSVELANWGVVAVKNMELMDLADAEDSQVIVNIMAKKISHIEMESRVEVAKNAQTAETAEINAVRTVQISRQDADLEIGKNLAEQKKAVGVANETMKQEISAQAALTKAKEMEVVAVGTQKAAEIAKEAAITLAEQEKRQTVITAEAALEQSLKAADGARAEGIAKADVAKALQLAPVEAQIVLAEKIANSPAYQSYLVAVEGIKGYIAVGTVQAEALQKSDIKVIVNAGDPSSGLNSVRDVFSSKGGMEIGAMLEGLKNTPQGKALLERILGDASKSTSDIISEIPQPA